MTVRDLVPLVVPAMVAAVVLTGCGGGGQDPAAGAAGTAMEVLTSGDPLPEATFTVLGGDEEVSTSSFAGRPTIINFWATWCAFCVDEMPDLEAAHQQFGEALRFVGIDRQDNVDKALALAEETGVSYLLLASPDGDYYTQVRARGMPTTLFVDADGVILHRHAGAITTEQLVELVQEKLGVSPVSSGA